MSANLFRHLLSIEDLRREDIENLLAHAAAHKRRRTAGLSEKTLQNKIIANVFFEDSTRTRTSFEIAAKSLGANVINWTTRGTSVSKGETLLDTVRNLDAMGPDVMILRHSSSGAAFLISSVVKASVINAGDGQHEHPSQALLDAFTLSQGLGTLEGKTIAIVGDIFHSRVARSNILCLLRLGAQVIVCGPPTLLPAGIEAIGCSSTRDLDSVLEKVDAIMALRVQLERQSEAHYPSAREYTRLWGVTVARAAKLKPSAIILHPGPINRGVELASEVADGPRSRIMNQVEDGIAMRMAILEACA